MHIATKRAINSRLEEIARLAKKRIVDMQTVREEGGRKDATVKQLDFGVAQLRWVIGQIDKAKIPVGVKEKEFEVVEDE